MSYYVRADAEMRRRGRVRAEHARNLARLLDRRKLMLRAWAIATARGARLGVSAWTLLGYALTRAWGERARFLAALA